MKKFLIIILFIIIILAVIFLARLSGVGENDVPSSVNKVYQDEELGIEFSYPEYWGEVAAEYLDNIPDLKGRVRIIEFAEKDSDVISAVSEDYSATPQLQSFSNDYEIYETIPLYAEHYNNKNISALEFCQRYTKNTLANLDCEEAIVSGEKGATVVYAYYIEEGMLGDGDEIYIERAAFLPMDIKEFPGLEIKMEISKLVSDGFLEMGEAELKQVVKVELDKISQGQASVYTQKKINEFNELIESFQFK